MTLAVRFAWTEAQIDATDPDLIQELLALVRAEAEQERLRAKERERAKRG